MAEDTTWLSIQEAAKLTGLAPSTIRYYDQQFEEFLGIRRGEGRRRLFSPEAVQKLHDIRRMLKEEGLSLRQARQALAGNRAVASVAVEKLTLELDKIKSDVSHLERQVTELRRIQERILLLIEGLTGR